MKPKIVLYFLFIILGLNTNAQIINTIAGNGNIGNTGDGGPATAAELADVFDIAIDKAGNVFLSDNRFHVVRKINSLGIINTVAGNGLGAGTYTCCYSGDGGPATAAGFNGISGIACDTLGNLYIADPGNGRIRKVNTNGIVTTFAGIGTNGFSGDGGPATAAELKGPVSISIDKKGNLFFVDAVNYRIRKVNTAGIITTVAGTGVYGNTGDGGPATAANISGSYGIGVDNVGNIYFVDNANGFIRKIDTSGIITRVAGGGSIIANGVPATMSQLVNPQDVKVDEIGNIFICDGMDIRKVNTAGIINIIVDSSGSAGFGGDNGPAISASLNGPNAIALDKLGNLYINDWMNYRVRKVTNVNLISIEQIIYNTEHQLKLFPNPTNDNIAIEFSNTPQINSYPITVIIYNTLGQPVSKEVINLTSQKYLNLNTSELNPGLYNILITQDAKVWEGKLIKQ